MRAAVEALGQAAERWLSGFSWVALLVAVVLGVVTTLVFRRRAERAMRREYEEQKVEAGR